MAPALTWFGQWKCVFINTEIALNVKLVGCQQKPEEHGEWGHFWPMGEQEQEEQAAANHAPANILKQPMEMVWLIVWIIVCILTPLTHLNT